MTQAITPSWTDNVAVQAPYALVKGSGTTLQVLRSTIDLRTKHEATLFVAVGTCGSTAGTPPCNIVIRRVLNNDGASHKYSAPYWGPVACRTTTGIRQINNAGNYAAGVQSFAFDGASGTAFVVGDLLFFLGVTSIPVASGAVSPAGGCACLSDGWADFSCFSMCESAFGWVGSLITGG